MLFFAFNPFLSGEAGAQSFFQNTDSSFVNMDSVKSGRKDNIRDSLLNKTGTDTKKKSNVKFEMKKSPWKAVVLSAILPGLGQAYNESYWKLPIVALASGTLGYYIFYNNGKYIDYRDKYASTQTETNPNGDEKYKRLRESYRDLRDTYLLYFAIFYLINLADAYVDAHLYDFSVSEKIKVGLLRNGSLANFKIIF